MLHAAASTHRVELREARFEDYEGVAALESSQGLASKPFEEWRHLWTANPCYQNVGTHWPIGWVLAERNRVVGCLSNIPLPYVFQGRQLLVAAGRGWAVEDQYRSYSLLLMDEYFNQPTADVFLNNTVNDKAATAFSTFGSSRVPFGDWGTAAFAITGHRGFAESALRVKGIPQHGLLSYPAGFALSLKDRFTAPPIRESDIEITSERCFDHRFDTFWERLVQRSSAFLAVRSRELLEWHFSADLKNGALCILTAGTNNTINAYAILQRRDQPQYGLKRLRMVDFQALDRPDAYCAAFMRHAYDLCRARRIHVLEQVGCELRTTRAFEQAAPYRRKLPSWSFFYSARNPELAAHLSQPGAWAPSSYDGDSSL